MKTSLQLFTNPRLLTQVGHPQVATLIDRLIQLFPGSYVLPSRRTDNHPFIETLAQILAESDTVPAPFLRALEEVEALAGPDNVPNLNIPTNVDPQDPESKPLYHAIQAWLSAHPAPVGVASSPSLTSPSSSPSDYVRTPSGLPTVASAKVGAVVIGETFPSENSCSDEMAPSSASVVTPGGGTSSGNRSAEPAPELESDQEPSSRPGLRLRLSVLFWEINPLVRHEFFAHFEKELREAFPELPPISVGDQNYDNAVYSLLQRPAFLPEPMRDALLAIQELAAPENRQLLRALTTWRYTYCEKEATAEHVAVSYWLKYPFRPGELPQLRAQVPPDLLAPKPPKPGEDRSLTDEDDGLPRPDSSPEAERPNSHHPGDLAAIARFPRNKIAKLPPEVREELNLMLRQRVPYDQLLARLGPRVDGINTSNLSRWKKTGYRVWLAEQERREDAQVQLELLFDLVQEKDNCKLHEATQQIAALRISQLLAAFDATSLTAAFQEHPQAFVRLVQTLPSLGRAGMDCERVLAELSDRKAVQDPAKKKRRGISKETMQYMTQALHLM